MSGPDTNPRKQTRRHLTPVLGIIFVVVIVILGFIWWFYDETDDPIMPGEESGTADEISGEANAPAENESPPE